MCCSVIPRNDPSDNSAVHVFQLPHKPQTLQGYAGKTERKKSQTLAASKLSAHADKPTAPRRTSTQKIQKTPQVNRKKIMSLIFTPTVLCFLNAL